MFIRILFPIALITSITLRTEAAYRETEFLKRWQIELSLANMPEDLRGKLNYFLNRNTSDAPSLDQHYFVLVGAPGVGKTVMARTFATQIGYEVVYFKITDVSGTARGELANRLRIIFAEVKVRGVKTVIILDELHDLYRNHADSFNDRMESASELVGQIDDLLESGSGNIVIIGTANDVSYMPGHLKNRFRGRCISVPEPSKEYKKRFLKEIIANTNIACDKSINDDFIDAFFSKNPAFVLRDIDSLLSLARTKWYVTCKKGERFTISAKLLESVVQKIRDEDKNVSKVDKKHESAEETRDRMHKEVMEQNEKLHEQSKKHSEQLQKTQIEHSYQLQLMAQQAASTRLY